MACNPWELMQGFREDCLRLITRFEKLKSVRYDGFCELWQDMKFSLVFAGRRSRIETLEFSEESLTTAKEFFLPPSSFKERIGGLYLLYGLYFKMPVTGPKIRVNLTEWQQILEFRAEIGLAEHHDVSFILSKLMSVNAFVHVFIDQELGLEKGYRLKTGRMANPYSVLPEIRGLTVPNDLFDRINVLSKHYESSKLSATSGPSTSSTTSDSHHGLRLYDSNFGQKLIDSIDQLEHQRKTSKNRSHLFKRIINRQTLTVEPLTDRTRKRKFRDSIRNATGHGFYTDSSPSEDDEPRVEAVNRRSLPDFFDDSDVSD